MEDRVVRFTSHRNQHRKILTWLYGSTIATLPITRSLNERDWRKAWGRQVFFATDSPAHKSRVSPSKWARPATQTSQSRCLPSSWRTTKWTNFQSLSKMLRLQIMGKLSLLNETWQTRPRILILWLFKAYQDATVWLELTIVKTMQVALETIKKTLALTSP